MATSGFLTFFDHGGMKAVAPHLTLKEYIGMAVFFNMLFLIHHLILHMVLSLFSEHYRKKDTKDKHDYRINLNALIFSVLATGLAIYATWFGW